MKYKRDEGISRQHVEPETFGWRRMGFDAQRGMYIYKNPGWPDEWVLTGGGFSLSAGLMKLAGPTELGSGGDYGLLYKFLERIGPSKK